MDYSPVFIVASERSGTNLIRKRITESQRIYFGPQPAHFLKHLYYSQVFYGELENDDKFMAFINDALGLCYKHFAPWEVDLQKEQVLREYDKKYQDRNAVGLMDLLMTCYAKDQGYQTYICKDNDLFDFLEPIQSFLPNAKFLYLYRDPRDVVLSQLNRKMQHDSVSLLARRWKSEQLKSFKLYHNRFSEMMMAFSYEDFIRNERYWLRKILKFLNLKNESIYPARQKDFDGVQEWENLNKPTMKDNFQKYRKNLSSWKIKAVEMICRDEMKFLGYDLENEKAKVSKISLYLDNIWGRLKFWIRFSIYKIFKINAYYNKNRERLKYIQKFKHP